MDEILEKYSLPEKPEPDALIEQIERLHRESAAALEDASKLAWLLAQSRKACDPSRLRQLLALLGKTETPHLAFELAKVVISRSEQMPTDLLKALVEGGGSEAARSAAIYALGSSSFGEAGALLVSIAKDPAESQKVRGYAIESLAGMMDERAVAPMVDLVLGSQEPLPPQVAFWVAYALGELRSAAGIPALESLLGDSRPGDFGKTIAQEAEEALAVIAEPGLQD
ncbi:MAG: HEAT repeat domain-containing protein [Acidobacteriota bacterium]